MIGVGDHVRAERERPTRGSWWRYEGREGFVASINTISPDYVEIGVTFESRYRPEARAEAWFLPDELVVIP